MYTDLGVNFLKRHLISLMAFIMSFGATFGFAYGGVVGDNATAIVFILLSIVLFFFGWRKIDRGEWKMSDLLVMNVFLYLGFAIPNLIANIPVELFWVSDSINTHVPESVKVMEFLRGDRQWYAVFSYPGRLTHSICGVFFLAFGVSPFSSLLALMLFKSLALYFTSRVGDVFFEKKIVLLALLIYVLSPTVLFYNTTLYKESAVQMLVTMLLLSTIMIIEKKCYRYLALLLLSLPLMYYERDYLALLIGGSFFASFYYFHSAVKWRRIKFFSFLIFLLSFSVALFFYFTFFLKIYEKVQWLRVYYSSFQDINYSLNYDIPYLLAFTKICFSPFFSTNKISMFFDCSSLLTWGAVVNQIIMLTSSVGVIYATYKKRLHISMWGPFLIFLLFAAYISPWSGRLRDSFYPLISIYSSFGLFCLIKWIDDKSKDAN